MVPKKRRTKVVFPVVDNQTQARAVEKASPPIGDEGQAEMDRRRRRAKGEGDERSGRDFGGIGTRIRREKRRGRGGEVRGRRRDARDEDEEEKEEAED